MKLTFLLPLAATGFFALSCGSNSPAPPSQQPGSTPSAIPSTSPSGSPTPSSAWNQVTESVTCEALANDHCVGFFGFTVDTSGNYTVGPADTGESLSGQISSTERAQLNSDATAVASGDLSGAPGCTSGGGGVPGASDHVDLSLSGMAGATVYDGQGTGNKVCTLGDAGAAQKLHTDLHQLMLKYYPTPFPPTASVTVGHWGSSTEAGILDVGAGSSGMLKFSCFIVTISALAPNSAGQINTTGTVMQYTAPNVTTADGNAQITGTVSGNSISLTVTYQDAGVPKTKSLNLTLGTAGGVGAC